MSEAILFLKWLYMLCGNPDPSDGEGTTPQEVTDSVRATLNKLIDAVPHTNCGSDDCFRCGFLEVKAENPAQWIEEAYKEFERLYATSIEGPLKTDEEKKNIREWAVALAESDDSYFENGYSPAEAVEEDLSYAT